jgi:HTH-type transcriptional regulator, competence development regulator
MSGNSTNDDAPTNSPQERLAALLREARTISGLSVRGAAAQARISATYISSLEMAAIKDPSPRILYQLAGVYKDSGLSYADLMRAAGYIVPGSDTNATAVHALDLALRASSPLSDDERAALLEYLEWYRSRHGRPPETR